MKRGIGRSCIGEAPMSSKQRNARRMRRLLQRDAAVKEALVKLERLNDVLWMHDARSLTSDVEDIIKLLKRTEP